MTVKTNSRRSEALSTVDSADFVLGLFINFHGENVKLKDILNNNSTIKISPWNSFHGLIFFKNLLKKFNFFTITHFKKREFMKKLNWMLNPLIIFASIFPLVSLSEALDSDSFKIVPYLIKKNSNQVHLRFKKRRSPKLYFKNNISSLIEVTTKEDKMTTLSSSIQKCDKPLRLTLNDEKENILYERTLEPFPCDPQKHMLFSLLLLAILKKT